MDLAKIMSLTDPSRPGDEPRGFRHEPVDVGEALVPQVDGDVDDVGDEAERRQRRVHEQRVETPLVGVV